VVRSFIGVLLDDQIVTPSNSPRVHFPPDRLSGAAVVGTKPGGPAEQAGIQSGDIIVEYNGKRVTDPNELLLLIARTPVGTRAPVVIVRDGKEMALEVTAEERP
jgi:serine protease Do